MAKCRFNLWRDLVVHQVRSPRGQFMKDKEGSVEKKARTTRKPYEKVAS